MARTNRDRKWKPLSEDLLRYWSPMGVTVERYNARLTKDQRSLFSSIRRKMETKLERKKLKDCLVKQFNRFNYDEIVIPVAKDNYLD